MVGAREANESENGAKVYSFMGHYANSTRIVYLLLRFYYQLQLNWHHTLLTHAIYR